MRMIITWKYLLVVVVIFLYTIQVDSKKKKKAEILPIDLPLIACDVCEKTIKELFGQVEEARKITPYNKLEEIQVLELMDKICKDNEEPGEWIRKLDIKEKTEKGKVYLKLTQPGGISKCEQECATIARSCSDLLDEDIDKDSLSALLWKGNYELSDITEKVCRKWSKRCPNKKTLTKKRIDYDFKPISEKDLEMEQLMAKMESAGLGGMSMYNKEDMEEMASGGFGGGDGYDDDMYGGDYADTLSGMGGASSEGYGKDGAPDSDGGGLDYEL